MVQTHKKAFLKHFNLPEKTMLSIEDISNITNIPIEALQIIWNRAIGAWKTNPQSVRLTTGEKDPSAPRSHKMSKERWAAARVYSFVTGGPTYHTADKDVAEHYGIVPFGK